MTGPSEDPLSTAKGICRSKAAIASGADRTVDLPETLSEVLDEVADSLASVFEAQAIDSDKLSSIMAKIADLSYASTGNGYYLYVKGTLKI